jgi:hypothetical protein
VFVAMNVKLHGTSPWHRLHKGAFRVRAASVLQLMRKLS